MYEHTATTTITLRKNNLKFSEISNPNLYFKQEFCGRIDVVALG